MIYYREAEKTLKISQPKFTTRFSDAFVEAGNEQFENQQFSKPNLTHKNGARWTTSHHNYYQPRPGHEILTNAYATKLIFKNNRVTNVEFFKSGNFHSIKATKGVILSAGVIETPKLLMLSGIGVQADLKKLQIPDIKNLPVGLNLQDHVTTGMDLILLNTTLETHPSRMLSLENIWKYFINGDGLLTHGGCEGIGFVNTNEQTRPNNQPDISFLLLPFGASSTAGIQFRKILNIDDQVWKDYFGNFVKQSIVSIIPILLHPKSRGKVTLATKNPFDPPLIDPKYLSHPDDLKTLVKGIKILTQLLHSDSFERFNAELNPKLFPGCDNIGFGTDQYWECYIQHLTLTMYHPVGTCPIGSDPSSSVVDFQFRVHGFENLYVVDASVMPNHISGNPNAAVGMIAQKFVSLLN